MLDCLVDDYTSVHKKKNMWRETDTDLQQSWNFPNWLGEIDNRDIAIQASAPSGFLQNTGSM